jgi:hypothetical protein
MVRIEILAGPEAGRVAEFGPGSWRAGRLKENDLVLPVDSVSGRHVEFTVAADGTVRFRDLGSTNGTFAGGAQVQEGEWFAGSELRLGGCALRLLAEGESGMLEEAAAEGRDAARAREAALTAKRSPLPLVLGGVLVLAAAGAGVWWFLLRDDGAERPGRGIARPTEAAGDALPSDAIAGLGDFTDAEAWSLADGATLRDGALIASGARTRATLLRAFDLEAGGLRMQAEVSGGARAQAWISFGTDAAATETLGTWCSGEIAGGTELALPSGMRWFKLALTVQGSGSVSALHVTSTERSVAAAVAPPGALFLDGPNWMLVLDGVPLLTAAAAAGAWTREEGGLAWSGGPLSLTPGPALLASGPALVLASGGPVAATPGMRVEQSPGLLLGEDLRRLLVRHEPATWSVADGALRSDDVGALTLRWDLAPALTDTARLAREIQTAERDGDDARLLATAARLLREFPLDEERNQAALAAQRAALERGRAQLAELEASVASVIFVGAVDPMEPLAQRAEALAAAFVGTPLGAQAEGLATALRGALDAGRSAESAAAQAWEERLLAALRGAYPALAAWAEAGN